MKNLLIVVADTMRYDDGMQFLDWMRDGSVSYLNAWAHGAATYPSFPSLWTGLEVNEHAATHRRTQPLSKGLGTMLQDAGYNYYGTTENPYTAWGLELRNGYASLHGHTFRWLAEHRELLKPPWAIVYHCMTCHWPYQFDPARQIPEGWPDETGVAAYTYHQAYRDGVQVFASHLLWLIDELGPETTIVTSDHGEAFGEHGMFMHDPAMHYPEQIHVPLIVHDGGRRYTDRGLLGLKHFPEIVLAAAEGKRVRARDEFVRVEDYHAEPVYSLVYNDHLITRGQAFHLPTDPEALAPIGPTEHPEIVPPPMQYENADEFVEPGDDDEVLERLRALGYA